MTKRKYEIQWFNDGPVGWTPDGIGDDNLFSNRRVAERIMADLRRQARQRRDDPGRMRVVEVVVEVTEQ